VNARKRRKTWSSYLYSLCCGCINNSKHSSRVHLATQSNSTGANRSSTVTETHPQFNSRSNDDDVTVANRSSTRDGSSVSVGTNRIYNRIVDSSDREEHDYIEHIQEISKDDDDDDDESVVARTTFIATTLQPSSSPRTKSPDKIATPVVSKEASSVEIFTLTNDDEIQ
jgi:hypothetical protein